MLHSNIPFTTYIEKIYTSPLLHGQDNSFYGTIDYFNGEGVTDILVAGELGPCSNGNGNLGTIEGCVGAVARILKIKGFNVRRIQGCVFPLMPYEPHFLVEQKRICSRPPFSELIKLPHNREGFEETKREMRDATRVLYEDVVRVEEIREAVSGKE